MNITVLKKLGLNDKEIKIYLGLLEYGSISVRGLAEITGLNRGTVYDILKKLQDVGLVSFYHSSTKQKFVAEDPDKIMQLIEAQEKELKKTKSTCADLIPELKSLQDKGGFKPATKLYEGKKGLKFILDDVLSSVSKRKNKEYYAYSATKVSEDINASYPDFTKKRIKNKISVKAISLAKGGTTSGLDERRWIGTDEEKATFVLIYAGKCAFISRDAKGSPVGVIIENQMIYDTQKIIFLSLWKKLK